MIYIAVDPGSTSGAITVMQTSDDNVVRLLDIYMMPKTEADIMNIFLKLIPSNWWAIKDMPSTVLSVNIKCIIESVHAFPGQGVTSMFSFGRNYGFLRGVLVSLRIPFIEVTPQKWMKYFGFKRNKNEDKKKHKLRILQKAQNLYPHPSVVLQTADSLMLAEFLRLTDNRK